MPDTALPEPTGRTALTCLGFDFGMRRIGVAAGQALTATARPLEILPARDGIPDWDRIAGIIEEWQPDLIVVGLPLNADGSEHEVTRAARRFMNRLQGRFGLPVHTVDERLSSVEAASRLRGDNARRARPDAPLDHIAAQVILETWLEQQRNPSA
jgi:putative Holliday junction resolvase